MSHGAKTDLSLPNVSPDVEDNGVYARRVVVPVSNPATAPQLIRFAASVVHPEKGKIKAVFVNTPDFPYKDAKEKLADVCEVAQSQNIPVELVALNAVSVQRGVLDAIREQNADLLVLGYQAPQGEKVVIGAITESIARVVPIDLIVYRHVPQSTKKRVIVPVTDADGTQTALFHAVHVAEHHNDIPVVALYVETDTPTPFWRATDAPPPIWQQMALMEMALYDEPYHDKIQSKLVKATDLVSGVVSEASVDDLIVLSVHRGRDTINERWLFGTTAQKMLRLAPGSIALVKRHHDEDRTILQRTRRYLARWTPTLTLGERTEVIDQAGDLVRTNTNFVVMIILSSILASVGLLQNSAAVIIGAMLVAPLMSPLMGFGVGLSIGDPRMLHRSSVTVLQGVLMVMGVGVVMGFVSAFPSPTNEMLSRGQPTLLDMIVALASGAAGSFALARRDIPAALAGVAIAAALVPPICTTGLAIALGDVDLVIGAGTLSIVNIICISLAAAGTFAVMGVRREGWIPSARRMMLSAAILITLAIPLAILLYNVTQRSRLEFTAKEVVEEHFEAFNAEVISVEIDGDEVTVTFRSSRSVSFSELKAVETEIEDRINRDISLQLVVLRLVQDDSQQ